ncbi:MAG: M81 family metallopeptidase [Lachnospiraceae bacterium]|nr:M81 family metallopeptidase [Lachnospiraceae bacterium]
MSATSPKQILVLEFLQESNTFNPIPDGLENFKAVRYAQGQEFYDQCRKIPCAPHGIFDAIEDAGNLVIPTISLRASSGGRVEESVFRLLCDQIAQYAKMSGGFDAICASLHGATCTTERDDACGDLLEFLRTLAGDRPISASCDLHANVTEKMLKNADIICGYQTYPHTDFYETGYRAASLCMKLLAGEPMHMAATTLPMMVPPAGYTSLEGAFKEVIDTGNNLIQNKTLLDYTTFQVQPWLDIPTIGSTVIAIASDPKTAADCADLLAAELFRRRDSYWPDLMSIDEAIDLAQDPSCPKPVLLIDAADSANGGAVGDSLVVAKRLLERNSPIRAGMYAKDPEAVKQAFRVGVGNRAEFEVGAKFTPNLPGSIKAIGQVRSLHDGHFFNEGPAGKGAHYYVGPAAVISFGNIDIMVCDAPKSTGDPQLLRHFGIEPTLYDLIVVKANTSFRASYGKFAGRICFADTPGAGASNLKSFRWKNLPAGFYPYDLPEDYQPSPAKIKGRCE